MFNSRFCLQNSALCSLQSVNMNNFSINIYYSSFIVVAAVVVVVLLLLLHCILKNSGLLAHSGRNITIQNSVCLES